MEYSMNNIYIYIYIYRYKEIESDSMKESRKLNEFISFGYENFLKVFKFIKEKR